MADDKNAKAIRQQIADDKTSKAADKAYKKSTVYPETEDVVGKADQDYEKQGGSIKKYASGGSIRGGGIESKGKTKGRMV